jgi:hypothetical protein
MKGNDYFVLAKAFRDTLTCARAESKSPEFLSAIVYRANSVALSIAFVNPRFNWEEFMRIIRGD